MIKLNLRSLGGSPTELDITRGESIEEAVIRAIDGKVPGNLKEKFVVIHNGVGIEKELWANIFLDETDTVVIAPQLKGDSSGMRALAMVMIAVTANLVVPGGGFLIGGVTISSGIVVAGVTIAGTLLVSSLIPPSSVSSPEESVEKSQMYSITSQSNKVNKRGTVPKVYGLHRIFPNVAAIPYIDYESDADGKLIQYLYGIYDFGLGPMNISDIRIGDTPITEFSDVEINLFDPNRPAISEGPWDDALNTGLKYYRGDVNVEDVGVTILKNQNDLPTPPADQFTVIRNTSPNPNLVSSEISVLLVAPRGLAAYSANGTVSERRVTLSIEFAKVGTEDWKSFNDVSVVNDFRAVGGTYEFSDQNIGYTDYTILPEIRTSPEKKVYNSLGLGYTIHYEQDTFYGLLKGSTGMKIQNFPGMAPGMAIRYLGETIGTIASITTLDIYYSNVVFESPTTKDIELVRLTRKYVNGALEQTTIYQQQLSRGIPNTGRAVLRGQDNTPIYATYKFWPKVPGDYKVRVTRISSVSTYSKNILDDITWSTLTTRLDNNPIQTDKRHAFLEIKIKATNQLNGSINNLSAIAHSVLDVWDGTQWIKQATSNPAWVFADLLTGEVNRRPLAKSRLHVESIKEWADYCDEIPPAVAPIEWFYPRFTCNFVLDFGSTLQQALQKVGGAALGSLNIIDGKYGVLIDRRRTTPVQIFSPRNTMSFSSTRNYAKRVHALNMQYIDPNNNWDQKSVTVYDDGYDAETATLIEDFTTFGVTNDEQAWRSGRFYLASNRLRQENIVIRVDMEYLIAQRGDPVQFVQDSMRVGGRPARVKSVVGNVITLDDAYEGTFVNWGYVFRTNLSEIKSGLCSPIDARTFTLSGDLPSPGDLIVIGEMGKVVIDCLVKAIQPEDDFSATLTLVERADAIYDSETGEDIPDYDPQLSSSINTDNLPPAAVENLIVVDNVRDCANDAYRYTITLDWESPKGSAYESFEIYVNWGDGFNLAGTTRDSIYAYIVDNINIGKEHFFKVLAVSSSGKKLELISAPTVSSIPVYKSTPPSNVPYLSANVTSESLELSWGAVPDCDVKEYLVRYSPLTDGGAWAASIPLPTASKNTLSLSVNARTGTYFIKAKDYNNNESAAAAMAVTTIPELFNLNAITEISDTPNFDGVKDRVVKRGLSLVLEKAVNGTIDEQEYYEEGYYYYRAIVDLGQIFTSRVQTNIQASGLSEFDFMSSWVPLSSMTAMRTVKVSDWDVETQYRVSNIRNVMADWDLLENIDPIAEGVQANFSEWRKFTMGDITGRIIQFRLKFISKRKDVTPQVYDGTIKIDMPDRDLNFNDMVAPIGGIYIPFTPPFKGPAPSPNIQITIDNYQSGDRYEFYDRDLTGFGIRFFDVNGDPVSRQFDAAVKGWGQLAFNII